MAYTWKGLAQSRPANTNAAAFYSPTAGTYGILKNLSVNNVTASATTFRIFIDAAGVATGKENALYYDKLLPTTTPFLITSFLGWDENGTMSIRSGTANAALFTASGCEAEAGDIQPAVYKVLGQRRPPVASGVLNLYQPSAGTIGIVKVIFVCNTEGTDDSYRLYYDINGATFNQDSAALGYDSFIFKNNTVVLEPNLVITSAGALGCSSAAGSQLTFTAFGIEIPA